MANISERPVAALSTIFDQLFGESFFNRWDREISGTSWPRVDIVEETDSYVLRADVPGLEKKDIKIEIENGTLTISGEKMETKREERKGRYSHLERSYGSFRRTFQLPANVDEKKIEAHYMDGVLELRMKKTEQAMPKAIEVKVD